MLAEIFTTQGRLNRLSYLKYIIVLSLASFVVSFIIGFIGALLTGDADSTFVNILALIVTFPFTVGAIMAAIRRLHDLNRSGWFMFAAIIPLLNLVLGIYLLFFKGTEGYNQYGEDPLAI